MVWDNEINELKQRQKLSKNQGGKESVSKHHAKEDSRYESALISCLMRRLLTK